MEGTDSAALATALIAFKNELKEIYSDLLRPGIQQVGKAIGEILEGKFISVTEWKEKRKILFQARMEAFRRRVEEIPKEKILSIPPDLGVPVLEKLSYVQDDMISQLFLNLLTTAANEETVNMAHPSFIRVIESLSADEAKLLLQFREKPWVICVQLMREEKGVRKIYGKRYGRLENTPNLQFLKNVEGYLSNFVGLGIISRRGADWFPEPPERDEFFMDQSRIHDEINREIERDPKPLEKVDAQGSILETIFLTAYGRMFLDACVKNIET